MKFTKIFKNILNSRYHILTNKKSVFNLHVIHVVLNNLASPVKAFKVLF